MREGDKRCSREHGLHTPFTMHPVVGLFSFFRYAGFVFWSGPCAHADSITASFVTPLELSANVSLALSVVLAGRNNIHTWWIGVVSCMLFGWLFFVNQLYVDVTLQAFFILTSLIGWWQWLRGHHGSSLAITRSQPAHLVLATVVGVAVAGLYGWLLHTYTDAYAPFIDSAVLTFSVIAQVLLMRRRLETWIFWLIVNTLAVPLYFSRELYVTSALYAAFWLNALIAWNHWKRQQITATA